jgi:hypothetical protein
MGHLPDDRRGVRTDGQPFTGSIRRCRAEACRNRRLPDLGVVVQGPGMLNQASRANELQAESRQAKRPSDWVGVGVWGLETR